MKSSKLVNEDIFLKTLIKSIEYFYDNHYFGDCTHIKDFHLQVLNDKYDRNFFNNGNLYDKRIEFLSIIQTIVDTEFCNNFL